MDPQLLEFNWDEIVNARWCALFTESFAYINTTWPLTLRSLKEEGTFYNFVRNQLACRKVLDDAAKDQCVLAIVLKLQATFVDTPTDEAEFIERCKQALCAILVLQAFD